MNKTMNNQSSQLDPKYIRQLSPDPAGGWTATIHEFPGCIAEGDTAEEALQNLENAADSWISSAQTSGYHVSPPVEFGGASGKLALRLSKQVHKQAAERASLEGVSLNQLVSTAIAIYLGQRDGMENCARLIGREFARNAIFHPMNPNITWTVENTALMKKPLAVTLSQGYIYG